MEKSAFMSQQITFHRFKTFLQHDLNHVSRFGKLLTFKKTASFSDKVQYSQTNFSQLFTKNLKVAYETNVWSLTDLGQAMHAV